MYTKDEKIINKLKQNILCIFLKVNMRDEFVILPSRLFQVTAPLYDKLHIFFSCKSVFGCGMKILFSVCRKLYLLLENEQMVERSLKLLWWIKGTNGCQKTCEIFHVYCIFYSGFMCQTTVIFGITKDASLLLNPLASWNCFTRRNLFQNGANDMSEWLTCETAFCKKAQNFI